ncbi:endonuclease III [Mucilaginibacter galii]|uniref:Endonuclease III n=1 Tax=Mucilaginibacter galii TaxID=2005073 RepID=A0A917N2D9_9SPHI|nr:endonuclease III [Mucilaginibacter galii]GGI51860.1 endonuclease III [Mucilaginibacter galii]
MQASAKTPYDIKEMLSRIARLMEQYPKAAMVQLYNEGYTSMFEQLLACIISIRTLDEVSIPVSQRLFGKARTPEQILKLSPQELEGLLYGSSYNGQKAFTMLGIAQTVIEQYDGNIPANYEQLTALKGVGPKCANLTLGIAAKIPAVSVDSHVHRVVNRWGYVQTKTPEKSLLALEKQVPKDRWIDINRLLMPFGKYHCTANMPKCSTCPVFEYCEQIGVEKHR